MFGKGDKHSICLYSQFFVGWCWFCFVGGVVVLLCVVFGLLWLVVFAFVCLFVTLRVRDSWPSLLPARP